MLSERRRKTIYSTNPRGLNWAKDKKKFGHRILTSMGWKEGVGLGKNENGITDNIKSSFKFDTKGLGYKAKLNDWIEENNVYEQILSDLSKQHDTNSTVDVGSVGTAIIDLEQKTKQSGRLHYRKFIKAKNLSIKSQNDLFSVFPTLKTSSNNNISTTNLSSNQKTKNDEKKEKVDSSSIDLQYATVESKLSIEDYFKQKMNNRIKPAICNVQAQLTEIHKTQPIPRSTRKKQKIIV